MIFTGEFLPVEGGIGTYVREMAGAAARSKFDVHVFAPRLSAGAEVRDTFTVHPLPVGAGSGLGVQLRTARCILAQRAQLAEAILYLPEPEPIQAMMLLELLGGVKAAMLVLMLYGSEINVFHARPHWRWLFRRLLKRADRVTVVSGYTRQLLLERFPQARDKVVLTPGALRGDLDTGCERSVTDGNTTTLLTVARIHPRKGQMRVLQALSRLDEDERGRLRYRLVGRTVDTRYAGRLREFAATNGVNLEMCGEIPDADLGAAYCQADIFIMTSEECRHSVEGFGLSYLEAAACGLPVIAHRIGGAPEAIRDGETGILIDPGDDAALVQALRRLAGSADLRAAFGRAGREWACSFSWTRNVERTFAPAP